MTDWMRVASYLGERLGFYNLVDWRPLDPLRCLLLSESEDQAVRLINPRKVLVSGESYVELHKWRLEVDIKDEDVGPQKVRIRGLPLHLWSLAFFRGIGGLCGGLVKVHEDTRLWKSFESAWIWIRSNQGLNIPREIDVFDRGKKLCVSIHLEVPEKKAHTRAWPAAKEAPRGMETQPRIQIQISNPLLSS